MKKSWILSVVLLVLLLLAFGIYRVVTKSSLGLMMGGAAVSSSTLVDNLSNRDSDLVRTSLSILKDRNDPAGRQEAAKLLASTDDYIWFNATLYLGAINDPQAVPYLIKGLKHPASRAYPDVVKELQSLTAQTFGMDQAKWIDWWRQKNPGSTFSFAYASLERQAAELHTGSTIAINRVVDPLTISHMGSPIALVGLRLKASANPAQAERLLETAMLYQFAELERDGTQLTSAGSVPALVYWVPDTINNPNSTALMRQGLGVVPFSRKTNLQGFLLGSGFYELDLSAVKDAGIRATLEALVPATQPSGAANPNGESP